jgi:hypothetical protein
VGQERNRGKRLRTPCRGYLSAGSAPFAVSLRDTQMPTTKPRREGTLRQLPPGGADPANELPLGSANESTKSRSSRRRTAPGPHRGWGACTVRRRLALVRHARKPRPQRGRGARGYRSRSKRSALTDLGPRTHNSLILWRPQGDSNPCYRRERAMSWASRRWGLEIRYNRQSGRNSLIILVEPGGIEPPTSCMPCKRSPS